MHFSRLSVPFVLTAGLLVASCAAEPPAPVDMSKTYFLSDVDGHPAGKVVLSPVGGGQMYDYNGQLIGTISPPVATAPPMAPAPLPQ